MMSVYLVNQKNCRGLFRYFSVCLKSEMKKWKMRRRLRIFWVYMVQ